MKIFEYDTKAGALAKPYEDSLMPWLDIVHPAGDLLRVFEEPRFENCLKRQGAILFVSTGGFNDSAYKTLPDWVRRKYAAQVHLLNGSHKRGKPYAGLAPFLEYVDTLPNGMGIEWDRLYPKQPAGDEADYVYSHDFEKLWKLDDALISEIKNRGKTTLLWDRTPDLPYRDVRLYLGAVDWGVALHLAASDGGEQNWHLTIKDQASGQDGGPGFNAYHYLRHLLPGMSVIEAETKPWRFEARDFVRQTWADMIARPSLERHAIFNLVGAQILCAGVGATPDKQIPALLRLLQVLGLVPEQSPGGEWPQLPDSIEQAVLIDDLADFGWRAFLEKVVGKPVKSYSDVTAASFGPEQNRTIPDLLTNAEWPLRLGGRQREVVFLDLRLFAIGGAKAESDFLAKILGFTEDLAGFAANKRLETPDHWKALTVLPRALAKADPTLPIVIFSTTARYEILKHFQDPNLIARDFAKPQFYSSATGELLSETQAKLARAIERVKILANGRAECLKLRYSEPKPDQESRPVVEFYLDESQRGGPYVVGGMCLVYQKPGDIDLLNQELFNKRKVWGLAHQQEPEQYDSSWQPPGDYLKKGLIREADLAEIQAIFEQLKIRCLGVALCDAQNLQVGPSDLLREDWLDNRHFAMVKELVTAALFVIADAKPEEVRVHIASRIADSPACIDDWTVQFGIRPQPRDPAHYFSLSSDTPRFLVSEMLTMHKTPDLPVTWARAPELMDFVKLKTQWERVRKEDREKVKETHMNRQPRPMQVHYLADWLAHLAAGEPKDIPKTARRWFRTGFRQPRTPAWQHWLAANRYRRRGEMVDAIYEAISAAKDEGGPPGHGFSRWIRPDLEAWIRSLDSHQFDRLCAMLNAPCELPGGASAPQSSAARITSRGTRD